MYISALSKLEGHTEFAPKKKVYFALPRSTCTSIGGPLSLFLKGCVPIQSIQKFPSGICNLYKAYTKYPTPVKLPRTGKQPLRDMMPAITASTAEPPALKISRIAFVYSSYPVEQAIFNSAEKYKEGINF